MYDNTVSFSGASDKYNYRISYGNNIQVPLVPGNTMRRNNFSVNAGAKLSNKLKINTSFSYVNNRSNRTQGGNQGANPLWRTIYAPRSYDVTGLPVVDDQGNQIWYSTAEENPYWAIDHVTRKSESNRFFGNINLNYAITKWLQADLKSVPMYSTTVISVLTTKAFAAMVIQALPVPVVLSTIKTWAVT
ncbi:MAG: hypothetical protein QM664_05100 [Flavihumibacter sp.]